ncbi:RNA polymerase sigma factor [Motilibacter aurantiacus]|uniref:RNA polymerase sigma factor n=1 Tax=Motilibacter aurantiacus TaxID=2714955 RepID=UPI001408318F|nr:RNA polymerase sigma factor [Motilibacter aurantiacus]NHC46024.1 RNA polymerase sigma factor [Motilibacter aurantiacus]
MTEQDWGAQAVDDLAGRLRSFLAGYLRDRSAQVDLEDVVQEALVRTWTARERLDSGVAVQSFALVTARNLALSRLRSGAAAQRAYERMPGPPEPPSPSEQAERADRARMLSAAIAGLPRRDQEALLRHDVEGEALADLAAEQDASPGALAARLARARSRLRVDYVLAVQRAELPTARCRPVLLALSAADRRRMRETGAMRHLAECGTCARLAEPLSARRLPAGWLVPGAAPLAGGPPPSWWRSLARRMLRPQAAVASAAVAAGAAVVGYAAVRAAEEPRPAAPRSLSSPAPSAEDRVVRLAGAEVLAVPADEGFWVAAPPEVRRMPGQAARLWVQLRTGGDESRAHLRAGDLVSGTGRLEPTGPGLAERLGVTAAEGARELDGQPLHLVLRASDLRVGR